MKNLNIIDSEPIDIIIPTLQSDFITLKLTVESLRLFVTNNINKIFIICQYNDEIIQFCNDNDLIYINETEYIGFDKDKLTNIPQSRKGWVYQQFLKLHGYTISETNNYLVCDADHILLKQHTFLLDNKFVFYYSDEYHLPYFYTINKLFENKYNKCINKSFISDKMIFNKQVLLDIKSEIESIHNTDWFDSICNYYPYPITTGFSEFETYGTYLLSNYKDICYFVDDNRMKIKNINQNIINQNTLLTSLLIKYNKYNSLTVLK